MAGLLLALVMGVVSPETSDGGVAVTEAALVLHTYECRIRLNGKVSITQVQASDAGQAKTLAQQQFPGATVLSVKKVD